jgi:hypothetical protein
MVAFSATFCGAAFAALAISSSSVGADLAPPAGAAWCIAVVPEGGGSAAIADPLKPKIATAVPSRQIDLFIEFPPVSIGFFV